jgi:glycosyltransferase involved in cell wall biosynthesis
MNGGIRVAAMHALALSRFGHSVTLVSPPPAPLRFWQRVKALLSREPVAPATPRRSHLDGTGLDHRVLDRCRPIVDCDVPDADVVIATWWETAEWVFGLSDSKGAKVHLVQGFEPDLYVPRDRCEAVYRMPMHRIAVARWLSDAIRDRYGDACVDVVPNSVDTAQFFSSPRGKRAVPTVGFVYARGGGKGSPVVLAAIDSVRKRIPQLRVIAFGVEAPGVDEAFPDYVEMTVAPTQDQLRALYAACDAWLLASRSEGFGLPAMEAMACRTPVVATRTGWPAEAFRTRDNGVLVSIDDHEALAEGLAWILALPDAEWRSLSERAYRTATARSWLDCSKAFEASLHKACLRAARGEIRGKSSPELGAAPDAAYPAGDGRP